MINGVINMYLTGRMTRQELETYLTVVGFSREIIDIHLMRADHEKARFEYFTEVLRETILADDEDDSQEDDNPF